MKKNVDGQMKQGHEAAENENELLDMMEDMARQHCFTDKEVRTYHGVLEFNVTDSGASSASAEALRMLAKNGRFRILREVGRMVIGYWPENEPITHP